MPTRRNVWGFGQFYAPPQSKEESGKIYSTVSIDDVVLSQTDTNTSANDNCLLTHRNLLIHQQYTAAAVVAAAELNRIISIQSRIDCRLANTHIRPVIFVFASSPKIKIRIE